MPIFEYYCPTCDPEAINAEEVLEMFSSKENVIPICKECKTPKEKKMSSGAFILKGPGFYINDYKPPRPKEKKE